MVAREQGEKANCCSKCSVHVPLCCVNLSRMTGLQIVLK